MLTFFGYNNNSVTVVQYNDNANIIITVKAEARGGTVIGVVI